MLSPVLAALLVGGACGELTSLLASFGDQLHADFSSECFLVSGSGDAGPVVENYFADTNSSTMHELWSLTELLGVTLFGVAQRNGHVDVQQPIGSYLPPSSDSFASRPSTLGGIPWPLPQGGVDPDALVQQLFWHGGHRKPDEKPRMDVNRAARIDNLSHVMHSGISSWSKAMELFDEYTTAHHVSDEDRVIPGWRVTESSYCVGDGTDEEHTFDVSLHECLSMCREQRCDCAHYHPQPAYPEPDEVNNEHSRCRLRWNTTWVSPSVLNYTALHVMDPTPSEYYQEQLAEPLSLANTEWPEQYGGHLHFGYGARSSCRDLLRIGRVWLEGGGHLLTPEFYTAAVTPRVKHKRMEFGFHFRLFPSRKKKNTNDHLSFAAVSGCGNVVYVDKRHNLVLVAAGYTRSFNAGHQIADRIHTLLSGEP